MKGASPSIVEDFRWLAPPADHPLGPWIWAAALGLIVVLAAAGFFLFRRKTGRLPFRPASAPHEAALHALRELSGLLRDDADREFVMRISGILRVYIQERFGLRAPHRSTEEFLHEARASAMLDEDHQRMLAGFLAQCDRVKFARQRMAAVEMQALFLSAQTFVEGTVPREHSGPGREG